MKPFTKLKQKKYYRRCICLRRDFCRCFRLSVFSHFVLIANIFNIGRDGRDGTVAAKVMYF